MVISECEADVEVLQCQVMAELDGMHELAQHYKQVKQQHDKAARACNKLAHTALAIKQHILTSCKCGKAWQLTSMTGMTSRVRSNSDDLAGQVSHNNTPALDKLINLQWVRVCMFLNVTPAPLSTGWAQAAQDYSTVVVAHSANNKVYCK